MNFVFFFLSIQTFVMSFYLEDFDLYLWKISQNEDHYRLHLAIRLKFLGIMNQKSKGRIGSELVKRKKPEGYPEYC